MTKPADLSPAADDLLHEIVSMIFNDQKYADQHWDAMSLVAIITDTSVDMTGFSYVHGDKPKPGTPRNSDIMDKLTELRQITRQEGEEFWKTLLIQVTKAEVNIHVTFEYDDANRWQITPGNLAVMKERLRPR